MMDFAITLISSNLSTLVKGGNVYRKVDRLVWWKPTIYLVVADAIMDIIAEIIFASSLIKITVGRSTKEMKQFLIWQKSQ